VSDPQPLQSLDNRTNTVTCGTYVNENYLDSSRASLYDDAENMNPSSAAANDKANRFFADGVVDVLTRWFLLNENYPYPDEATTRQLANEANISAKQVRKWFANKRVRSNKCMKQSYRKRDNPSKTSHVKNQVKILPLLYRVSNIFSTTLKLHISFHF
jgi:hypothetical protein